MLHDFNPSLSLYSKKTVQRSQQKFAVEIFCQGYEISKSSESFHANL